MQFRHFGRTGLDLSILGFGCGAVGGLMVRADKKDQERTIARALYAGINYFDTAVQYGNGASEANLGNIFLKLRPSNAVVGTKVRLQPAHFDRISGAITDSLEGSLRRLNRERVDILHLHNPITNHGGSSSLSKVFDRYWTKWSRPSDA
jgi:aryl-alcohol dehydrogenase-like predicted oxidoreductase